MCTTLKHCNSMNCFYCYLSGNTNPAFIQDANSNFVSFAEFSHDVAFWNLDKSCIYDVTVHFRKITSA